MENRNPGQEKLDRLFRLEENLTDLWQSDELEAIFQHQLSASPEVDLRSFDAATVDRLVSGSSQASVPPRSYRELFQQSHPSTQWLDLTKRFAKAAANDGSLPREIAAVLYLAAISAAWVHGHCRITELDNDALLPKIAWAVTQPWLDEQTRQLLDVAQATQPIAEND